MSSQFIELDRNEVQFLLNATMQLAPVQVGNLDSLRVDPSIHNLVTKLKTFMSEEEVNPVVEAQVVETPTETVTEPVAETPVAESAPVVEASEAAPADANPVVKDPNDPNYA